MRGVIRGSGDKTVYLLDGKEVTKRQFFAAFPEPVQDSGAGLIGWKPLHSDGLAVHPDMIGEYREDAIKKGVPTEFNPEFGQPIFTSRTHRRAYLKAYGYHDRDGSYGDG